MPPGKQAQAIARMKFNTNQITELIAQYAGRPGKPSDVIENILEMEKPILKYLPGIVKQSFPDDPTWNKLLDYWLRFMKTFENGDGSWTESLAYIKKMNDLFKTIQT